MLHVAAHPVRRVIDTTGAGDLYAAGFLYGYTQGRELKECGRLGSIAAVGGDHPRRAAAPRRAAYADQMIDSARAEAERWLAAEPDEDIRDELEALIAGPVDELAERFDGRLQFGTAGLRAAVGAGPQRMNRLVVRQAAAGLAQYLLDTDPRARERGVIIGYDARRKSDVFALDTACVMAAYGIRAMLFDQFVPTPVLAWSITEVDAAAGVVVTASHNPPADNGYKVYLGDGAQIVPPARRRHLGPDRRGRSNCGRPRAAGPSADRVGRRRADRRLRRRRPRASASVPRCQA